MPKRTDIKSILILGAGPIVIGQACEFDYSGAQACKALREEGYRVILVNSNPATIMTDPDMADATYIEPIKWQTVAKIIEKERPDELTIEQCIERRVEILDEQRNRLGRANSALGGDLVLGDSVRDRSGKFRIHIRELDWQRFHEFLPIGFGYQPLCALVRFTLRDPIDYDIRLVLRQEEIRELRIGEQNACRLGWTSWLGREKADGVVTLGSKIH